MMTYWLSYGGGVNSTALLVLLVQGKLPQYDPWRVVFADTGEEKDQTYAYIDHQIKPWLAQHGRELEVVHPPETVLERWQRLRVTGSRTLRTCTDNAKRRPIEAHLRQHGTKEDVSLIGIDAGEQHRARPSRPNERVKLYPLVDLNIDRIGCADIIRGAGLCVPTKSGCWHCPFMRVGEILTLARERPDRFALIEQLEAASIEAFPVDPGKVRAQWADRPARYWRDRAALPVTGDLDWADDDGDEPCECYR